MHDIDNTFATTVECKLSWPLTSCIKCREAISPTIGADRANWNRGWHIAAHIGILIQHRQ